MKKYSKILCKLTHGLSLEGIGRAAHLGDVNVRRRRRPAKQATAMNDA